ncbi:MAG: MBOAT family protein [Oscillospiraceae bacterium]|nr:MBOAT family protein [Oscillospiraceae bacterium]
MVFSSLLFVFPFLTANLLSQILIKSPRKKNIAMLIFSLIFYSWSGPRYLILLVGMSFICYVGAQLIEASERHQRLCMWVTVLLCLVILGIFKYTGFFLTNIQGIFGVPEVIPRIVLPIGISFYTFQLISYVVDVYRGEVEAQKKYWMLLLYASLFHQCIAGPIVRYQDIRDDIVSRRTTQREISEGISRFAAGLAKKAILANGCAAVADSLLAAGESELASLPSLGVFFGACAYTLQIYLDFSAYSDMAIGMGLMCGFHYKENFNYPYVSDSITEFWRRWHISLSSFFRDYVYIPLGGSRCGLGRQIFNLFVVWGLTGLWHGASWNFVLWGLYYGLLLCLERYVFADVMDRMPRLLRHVLVMLLVIFGWILFKFTDIHMLGLALKGLFGLNHNGFTSTSVALVFKNNMYFLLFCVIAVTPLGKYLRRILQNLSKRGGLPHLINGLWEIAHPAALLILSAMALAGNSYNPFLYFQF